MSEDRMPVRDAYAKAPFLRIDRAPDGTIAIEGIDAIEPECVAQEGVCLHREAKREWTALLPWSHDLKTLEAILPESP